MYLIVYVLFIQNRKNRKYKKKQQEQLPQEEPLPELTCELNRIVGYDIIQIKHAGSYEPEPETEPEETDDKIHAIGSIDAPLSVVGRNNGLDADEPDENEDKTEVLPTFKDISKRRKINVEEQSEENPSEPETNTENDSETEPEPEDSENNNTSEDEDEGVYDEIFKQNPTIKCLSDVDLDDYEYNWPVSPDQQEEEQHRTSYLNFFVEHYEVNSNNGIFEGFENAVSETEPDALSDAIALASKRTEEQKEQSHKELNEEFNAFADNVLSNEFHEQNTEEVQSYLDKRKEKF